MLPFDFDQFEQLYDLRMVLETTAIHRLCEDAVRVDHALLDALADAVARHYDDILSLYGSELGLRVARKHLGWYAEANGAPNRAELMRAPTPGAALAAIRAGFADAAPQGSPA